MNCIFAKNDALFCCFDFVAMKQSSQNGNRKSETNGNFTTPKMIIQINQF